MRYPALVWLPRVFAIALALLLGAFGLDAFSSSEPLVTQLTGFVIHLVPAVLVLLALTLAWRNPPLGALAYLVLAGAFAVVGGSRARWSWYAIIVLPLLLLSALNLALWKGTATSKK